MSIRDYVNLLPAVGAKLSKTWNIVIYMDKSPSTKILTWAEDAFGPCGRAIPKRRFTSTSDFDASCRWIYFGNSFLFHEEKDAALFRLHWC